MSSKLSKTQAIHELWRRGQLSYKLDVNQKILRQVYKDSKEKINVWLLSRRLGKTTTLVNLGFEVCLSQPKSIVKFLSPTKMMAKQNVRPIIDKILEDCPEDLKPTIKEADYIYYFPNGSEFQMAGADSGHAEKLRGADAHLCLIDEAGSIDRLDYIVKSILLPTTLLTKGKIILAGTPPVESEHDMLQYIETAEMNDTLIKKTIYDIPRLTPDMMAEAEKEQGGKHTDGFRREYLVEIIKDANSSVIPEFDEKLAQEIVKDWPTPPFYDSYVAMDLGFKDLTVLVFGYYDFRAAKIIIQDELVVDFKQPDMNLKKLCSLIKEKEEKLWTNPLSGEVKKPSLRVSDIDYIVLQEIYNQSNRTISFTPASKYDKEANINNLRTLLVANKVIINPRCVHLIRHLKNVKWNKSKKEFARSAENGHYDLVDALLYFARHVSLVKNPYPLSYGYNQQDLYVRNPEILQAGGYNTAFNKIFNRSGKK
jgi:hypothetical protein